MTITASRDGSMIDEMVNRFVAWPLPESVCSDVCATKRGYPHRSGTNLLSAAEARQMFEYVLGSKWTPQPQPISPLPLDIETLARQLHEIDQQEAKRQKIECHNSDTVSYRALARHVLKLYGAVKPTPDAILEARIEELQKLEREYLDLRNIRTMQEIVRSHLAELRAGIGRFLPVKEQP